MANFTNPESELAERRAYLFCRERFYSLIQGPGGARMLSISAGDVGGREGVHRYPGRQASNIHCDVVGLGLSDDKEVQPVALFGGPNM